MFEDLQRAKNKLGKAYEYASCGRCKSGILSQYGQQDSKEGVRKRSANCSSHEVRQSSGKRCNSLARVRCCPLTKHPITILQDELYPGLCVHPVSDLLGECFRVTILGSKPVHHLRSWLRDIVNILKDSAVLEDLFQILTPKKNHYNDASKGCREVVLEFSHDKEPVSSPLFFCHERYVVEKEDVCDTVEVVSEAPILGLDGDHAGESSMEQGWSEESEYIADSASMIVQSGGSSQSEREDADDLMFAAVTPDGYIDVGNSGTPPSDTLPDCEEDEDLPCLNHNTSLTTILSSAEDERYDCDLFPLDEMTPLCSTVRKTWERGPAAHCVILPETSPMEGDMYVRSGGDDLTNCIDPISDTYTFPPGLPMSVRNRKFFLDDGAQGDGVHFNMGKHPVWWCTGDFGHRESVGVFPSPSPQDRLARITYKTQPSNASSADAPMFVFTSDGAVTTNNLTTSRMIPLDFNLNAIYKSATRDERGAGDNTVTSDEDAGFPLCTRGAPEGSSTIMEESKPEGIIEAAQTFNEAGDCGGDVRYKNASSRSTSGQPYVFYFIIMLCALLLMSLTPHYWSKESIITLFWGVLVHASLVGILLLLLLVGLEANNLTESVVKNVQQLIHGTLSKPTGKVLISQKANNVETVSSKDPPAPPHKKPTGHLAATGRLNEKPKLIETVAKRSAVPKAKPREVSSACLTDVDVFTTQDVRRDYIAPASSAVPHNRTKEIVPTPPNAESSLEPVANNDTVPCASIKSLRGTKDATVCAPSVEEDSQSDGAVEEANQKEEPTSQSHKEEQRTFVEMSTMTEHMTSTDLKTSSQELLYSVVQTMTEMTSFQSSATQTEHTIGEGDRSESGFQIVEIWPEAASIKTANASVQANVDAKRVYQQTERLKQRQELALRRLQKKFLAIRRRCQKEALEMKHLDRRKNDFLSKLQLSLPNLQKEKSSLMAERASIDRQFEDEKKKNRELVARLTRINQQFYRLGQVQQQPPPPPLHWRQQYQQHQQTYQMLTNRPHCDPTVQFQSNQKPGHAPAPHLLHQQPHQPPLHHQPQQSQPQPQQQPPPNAPLQHAHHQFQQKIHQQSTLLQNQVRCGASSGNNPSLPPGCQPPGNQHQLQKPQPVPPPQQQPLQYQQQPPQQQQQKVQLQQHPMIQQQQQFLHQQRLPIFQLFNKSFCQPPHPEGHGGPPAAVQGPQQSQGLPQQQQNGHGQPPNQLPPHTKQKH